MKKISFTTSGFTVGNSYYVELLKDGVLFEKVENLVNGQKIEFTIVVSGTYEIRVIKVGGECISSTITQVLFPIVEYIESGVDCVSNTYTYTITLTNPTSSGINVKYGFSFENNCSSVNNWSSSGNFIVPADDIVRYFYVKNDNSCCNIISPTVKSACTECTLQVSAITFNCN